ncbi:RecX family transcriptional regulator [Roseococcus sp. YIM B11640]|uniref:RecX family transcriptional regulator n=1 Tax=Roseococcus sp. YIM B11640 TaxID=3133973 RepID=UPI003C7E09BD
MARAPAITEAALREAALSHLARFAATEAGLRRVLGNRIHRWARAVGAEGMDPDAIATAAAAARAQAAAIAARLVQAGAVDDAAFATARARRLLASGRSQRATLAHLAAKGITGELARETLRQEDMPGELEAAVTLCRKRRLGPFAAAEPEAELRRKWLATLARAGFGGEVARKALALPRAEAEALLANRP